MKKKKLKKLLARLEARITALETSRETKDTGKPVIFRRFINPFPGLGPLAEGEKTPETKADELAERLNAIEKATELHLTPHQREAILSPQRPTFDTWGRCSGKTTAACLWTLLHREAPILWKEEERFIFDPNDPKAVDWLPFINRRAIPDEDGYRTYLGFRFLQQTYIDLKLKCLRNGIQTCPTYFGRNGK